MSGDKSCITPAMRSVITGLRMTKPELVMDLIEALPECPGDVVVSTSTRAMPTRWVNPKTGEQIKPVYYDDEGQKREFSSVSAAAIALAGKMSGTICDDEGKSCKAADATEIMTIKGFVVRDNGDQPVKGVSERITIYHPNAPQLKKLSQGG